MVALIGAQEPSALAAIASDIDSQAERFRCDQNLAIPIAKGFGLLSAVTVANTRSVRTRFFVSPRPCDHAQAPSFPACAAKAPPLTGASTKIQPNSSSQLFWIVTRATVDMQMKMSPPPATEATSETTLST